MAPWQGVYRGESDLGFMSIRFRLRVDGESVITFSDPLWGGDAIRTKRRAGMAIRIGDWIAVADENGTEDRFFWFPFQYQQRRCLINRVELLEVVNRINATGEALMKGIACADGKDGDPPSDLRLSAASPLPQSYRDMLLTAPLSAAISAGRDRKPYTRHHQNGQVDNGTQMRIEIDRGTLGGVFTGMRLYSTQWNIMIDEVTPAQAFATIWWTVNGSGPATGTVFSSRPPPAHGAGTRLIQH